MTCPIGGGAFDFTTATAYSVSGTRADGKPYGSWTFPMALPECPDNGLVLYKEYTDEEVAKLEPLVASEAYQALRQETPYYRASWLMREMGLPPQDYLWALLQASWEADDKPELRARYLAELAERSAAVPAAPDDLNWVGMEARAANALRELGRFDEATARLERIPASALEAKAGATGKEAEEAAKRRRGWANYVKSLRALILSGNTSRDPFEMLPKKDALARCAEGKDALDQYQSAFCAGAEKASADAAAAIRQTSEEELEALKQSREKSGR
jgi:hypothetical protein